MKKPRSFSPIAIIEQLLFEKLGNTRVRVWHYCALLTLLFIVPNFLPISVFENVTSFSVFMGLLVIIWMSSRLIGRQLSKTSSIDSVLIYRFFIGVPWVVGTIFSGAPLFLQAYNNEGERALAVVLLSFSVIVSAMHIIGIILHLRSLKKTIRNVNKEDLFQ
jgi:hypothetical protein